MTKKQELLLKLDLIKTEHLKWVHYAEAKFKGLDINENLTPVKHTDCACGKMIAENGQIIYHLKSAHTLMTDHEEFHKIGEDLYHFMQNMEKGNLLTKKSVEKKNREMLRNYAEVLRQLSNNLLRTFDNINNEINCIDDEKIEAMLTNPDSND
ncbi:MAG: hypothetical protein GXO50_02890 [Chlorobi bacterium]|nr:hypothetical protein [Chlorobiota bacterium]